MKIAYQTRVLTNFKRLMSLFISVLVICATYASQAAYVPITLFPLDHYSQKVDDWLRPDAPNYKTRLVSEAYQRKCLQEFARHLFFTGKDSLSPWSRSYVEQVLAKEPSVQDSVKGWLKKFSNEGKTPEKMGYGENFRPYSLQWIKTIQENINLGQFARLSFDPTHRAILTENVSVRALPTHEPHFNLFKLTGYGYPFDHLQMSSLWVGTPLYVFGQTRDKSWSLVLGPAFYGWIPSGCFAKVDDSFIARWQRSGNRLAAIIRTGTSVIDEQSQRYRFTTYVGSVFPVLENHPTRLRVLIPVQDSNGKAQIHYAVLTKKEAVLMPLAATREHFALLIRTLQNRPYGWGNFYFYNDCSTELKNLYTPFAIWLPRNSAEQAKIGKIVDESALPMAERIDYLIRHGHPLMTFVYIGGHVFLYLGNYLNPIDLQHGLMAMTYQNVWALRPRNNTRPGRAVIGQSVLFPLLANYPERYPADEKYPQDEPLDSLANKKHFKLVYLDG